MDTRPPTDASDDERLAFHGAALADAVVVALPSWVTAAVLSRVEPSSREQIADRVELAGANAATDIGSQLRHLLALDVDEQWTNPLTLIRTAANYANDVLRDLAVPPPSRDADARRLHPEDTYDLTPGAFGDLGPEVHELGLIWGAAKAHTHLQRRRSEVTPR